MLIQSAITIDVIDQSLERHVAQYLIERTTQELMMREVTVLHGWLVLTSSALLVCVGWLVVNAWQRRRRQHAKIS